MVLENNIFITTMQDELNLRYARNKVEKIFCINLYNFT